MMLWIDKIMLKETLEGKHPEILQRCKHRLSKKGQRFVEKLDGER